LLSITIVATCSFTGPLLVANSPLAQLGCSESLIILITTKAIVVIVVIT